MNASKNEARFAVAVSVLALWACDGLLEVSDPNRLTSEDVDGDLAALANVVSKERSTSPMDTWVVLQALLADVYSEYGHGGGNKRTRG